MLHVLHVQMCLQPLVFVQTFNERNVTCTFECQYSTADGFLAANNT